MSKKYDEAVDLRNLLEHSKARHEAKDSEIADLKCEVARLRTEALAYTQRIITGVGLLNIIAARYLRPETPPEFVLSLNNALKNYPFIKEFRFDAKLGWVGTTEVTKKEKVELARWPF